MRDDGTSTVLKQNLYFTLKSLRRYRCLLLFKKVKQEVG